MNFFRAIQFRISRGVQNNFDILLLWVLLMAVQPQISVDHILAREDLIPWLMFCLGCAVVLRGKRYGDGPHSSLTKRVSTMGAIYLKAGMLGSLVSLVFWFDLGFSWEIARTGSPDSIKLIGLPLVSTLATLVLIYLGRGHEQTAWDPRGVPSVVTWGLGLLFVIALGFGIGRLEKIMPEIPTETLLLGLGFLSLSPLGLYHHHNLPQVYLFQPSGNTLPHWLTSTLRFVPECICPRTYELT